MKAHGYIVSVIQLLQSGHRIYSIVTPGEFDILYRWWEKRIPLSLIDECTAQVVSRRLTQGKAAPRIKDLAHAVRRGYTQYRERAIGSQGKTDYPVVPASAAEEFIRNPPPEIADLVAAILAPAPRFPVPGDVAAAFQQALLERFAGDEELERRTLNFSSHLAPALRSASLMERYRVNLLVSRFRIPDLEGEEGESS